MKLTPEQSAALDTSAQIPYTVLSPVENERLQSAILSGHVVEIRHIEGVDRYMLRLHYRAAFVAGQEWIPPRKFVELWPTIWAVNVQG